MFTGIIEEVGKIRAIQTHTQGGRIKIAAQTVLQGVKLGDSIAINGVCLTVVDCNNGEIAFDISTETLARSTLGRLRAGSAVNLERALAVGDRLGGHIVQGHVDGNGEFLSRQQTGDGSVMRFSYPTELGRYICLKGSICVDGISLTVSNLANNWFEVAIIPHTLKITNLTELTVGSRVNLEVDILAKYVERMLYANRELNSPNSTLTLDKLRELGY
ncbi:MAG: riboflavin synthase [Acidobacteriota bacterium]